MKLTSEDEHTIEQYIRAAHGGYTGRVGIWMERLKELHMPFSRLVVMTAMMKARHESKRAKNA
ncbi:hypothetical protein [Serratia fonticola]|uniref:hypothetical protein n=1 Tax=Serratia fonticola TaxID=47917 RepID=UPI001AE1D2D8|nr:hypothetical protein [Serratia fonticola]MBP0998235.1 hypothetical protein [Serratia fonticola]